MSGTQQAARVGGRRGRTGRGARRRPARPCGARASATSTRSSTRSAGGPTKRASRPAAATVRSSSARTSRSLARSWTTPSPACAAASTTSSGSCPARRRRRRRARGTGRAAARRSCAGPGGRQRADAARPAAARSTSASAVRACSGVEERRRERRRARAPRGRRPVAAALNRALAVTAAATSGARDGARRGDEPAERAPAAGHPGEQRVAAREPHDGHAVGHEVRSHPRQPRRPRARPATVTAASRASSTSSRASTPRPADDSPAERPDLARVAADAPPGACTQELGREPRAQREHADRHRVEDPRGAARPRPRRPSSGSTTAVGPRRGVPEVHEQGVRDVRELAPASPGSRPSPGTRPRRAAAFATRCRPSPRSSGTERAVAVRGASQCAASCTARRSACTLGADAPEWAGRHRVSSHGA